MRPTVSRLFQHRLGDRVASIHLKKRLFQVHHEWTFERREKEIRATFFSTAILYEVPFHTRVLSSVHTVSRLRKPRNSPEVSQSFAEGVEEREKFREVVDILRSQPWVRNTFPSVFPAIRESWRIGISKSPARTLAVPLAYPRFRNKRLHDKIMVCRSPTDRDCIFMRKLPRNEVEQFLSERFTTHTRPRSMTRKKIQKNRKSDPVFAVTTIRDRSGYVPFTVQHLVSSWRIDELNVTRWIDKVYLACPSNRRDRRRQWDGISRTSVKKDRPLMNIHAYFAMQNPPRVLTPRSELSSYYMIIFHFIIPSSDRQSSAFPPLTVYRKSCAFDFPRPPLFILLSSFIASNGSFRTLFWRQF